MKRYVVAHIDFFDNVLEQNIVNANSKIEAIHKVGLHPLTKNAKSMKDVYNNAFNADCMVEVTEIPED